MQKPKGKSLSALIADDEELIVTKLQEFLQSTGYFKSIVVAKDGQEAANKINNQDFDLLILDIQMPKLDGIKVLESIDGLPDKVMMVSGNFETEHVLSAKKAGVKHFVRKPFNRETILERVRKCLHIQE